MYIHERVSEHKYFTNGNTLALDRKNCIRSSKLDVVSFCVYLQ